MAGLHGSKVLATVDSLSLVVEVANMVKEANMVEAVQVRSSTV